MRDDHPSNIGFFSSLRRCVHNLWHLKLRVCERHGYSNFGRKLMWKPQILSICRCRYANSLCLWFCLCEPFRSLHQAPTKRLLKMHPRLAVVSFLELRCSWFVLRDDLNHGIHSGPKQRLLKSFVSVLELFRDLTNLRRRFLCTTLAGWEMDHSDLLLWHNQRYSMTYLVVFRRTGGNFSVSFILLCVSFLANQGL